MTWFQRPWRSFALVFGMLLPAALLGMLAVLDSRDLMTDGGSEGPFAVLEDGTLGGPIAAVPAGEVFGWRSRLCLDAQAEMLAKIELVQVRTRRVFDGRTRRWQKGARDCGLLPGMIRVSRDVPPGHYVLERTAVLRPDSWVPLPTRLSGVPIEVLPARTFVP